MKKIVMVLTVLMAGVSAHAISCGVFSTNPQNNLAMKDITQRQEYIFEEGTTKYGVKLLNSEQYAVFVSKSDNSMTMAVGSIKSPLSLFITDMNRMIVCMGDI